MGHYYAEMFPNGEDKTFGFRWADYQKACAREISDIIKENPIKLDEVEIGDELTLYEPLKGLSKIRFDDEGEFHKIRELFGSRAKYSSWEFWSLANCDNFTCYDKRIVTCDGKEFPEVRTDKPRKFDWPQFWLPLKYFQKK